MDRSRARGECANVNATASASGGTSLFDEGIGRLVETTAVAESEGYVETKAIAEGVR